MKEPKPKPCKDCREVFTPFKFAQPRCVPCAIAKGRNDERKNADKKKLKAIKEFKAETTRRKAALKGRSEYKREAQTAFNAFIRERDSALACISCGKKIHGNKKNAWDAGHYRSRGASPELAFIEENCHKQCKKCNNQLSGNIVEYRSGLLKKIGLERLEWLEGPHKLTRHTIDDYQAIKKKYKQKLKDLIKIQ